MATYTFRFDEVSMNQVWFEAANEEEAKELLRKCETEEIMISDLPNVQERNRGIIVDFSDSFIEED